ncbi:MAG: hypothetical protein P4M11_07765 [Candidatus Pacebacteria bacterium]|nr:hypothetical protein [Candidatus Paceibacterota bacterium]
MKKNYGRDVKIYRLIDGEMCPIDEKNSCLVEEAFESDAETNGDTKREDGAKTDAVTVAKKIVSREQFISKMRDSTSRSAAKSLTLAVAGSALAVLLICILEYLLTVQSSADAVYRTKIVIWTFNYIEYLYKANFMVHQLLLGKEAIYYPYSNLSSLIAGEKDSLNDIIDAVSDIEHDYSLDMNVYKERVYVNYTYTYGTTVSILYNQSINYVLPSKSEM